MNFRLLFCLGQKAAAQLTAAGIDILSPALAQGAGDAAVLQFLLKSQDLIARRRSQGLMGSAVGSNQIDMTIEAMQQVGQCLRLR
jgi:hypothetical protein